MPYYNSIMTIRGKDHHMKNKWTLGVMIVVFMVAIAMIIIKPIENNLLMDTIIRLLYSLIICLIIYELRFKLFSKEVSHIKKIIFFSLPALLISINNFPWIAYINQQTEYHATTTDFYYFILSCIAIGMFEELMFRGLILNVLLDYLKDKKHGMMMAMLISSFLFGFIHIFNIFSGASVTSTLLQVSYSFLTGLLWSAVFILTKQIIIVIILHASYNFFGLLFPTLGIVRNQFDIFTILLTIIVSILVSLFYLYFILKLKPIKQLIQKKEPEN